MARTVDCIKLQEELPGLPYPPMRGELGRRIFAQVSEKAWGMWLQHSTMVINEHRLRPAEPEGRRVLREQLERFLFGEGAQPPPDFAPAD
jgi:Fe-S cluster biosynthesis and repair protein YggX